MLNASSIELMGQTSLLAYATALKPKFKDPPHIQMIIKALEAVESGRIRKLMIFAPPRHGKSLLTSQIFPAWYQGKHPDHMVMVCCHTQQLATQFGGKIRSNLLDPTHKQIFPDYSLASDSHAKHEWKSTQGGEFFAAGVGGGISGRGAHLCLIDDPVRSAEDAQSQAVKENLYAWWQSDLYTRLEPDARVVIIQTRWTENDLAGWLLDEHEQEEVDDWKTLTLPAIAERDEGWRKEGDPLWKERFPLHILQKIRKNMTDYQWQALYQQTPAAVEGLLIKRGWWKNYAWNPHMAASRSLASIFTNPYRITLSIDSAFEEAESNDFSVIGVWLSTRSGRYLLDVWRKRVIAPDLFRAVTEMAIYWKANAILVEKKASGHGLIQQIMRFTRLPVIGVVPKGSKLVRMQAVSPLIEAGTCYLPYQAHFLKDYLQEMSTFPGAAHDDQVDMTSQFLDYDSALDYQQEKFENIEAAMNREMNIFDV